MNEEIQQEDRGRRAQELLDNDLFKAAFEDIKQNLVDKIESVSITDEKTQSQLILSLQLLKQLKLQLETHVQTGEMIRQSWAQRKFNRKVI